MRSNIQRQSKSFAERQRRRKAIGAIAGILALASWMFVAVKLVSLPVFAINTVEIYGSEPDAIPAMQAAAMNALNGSYIGVFSKANTFIYPKGDVATEVASASPLVSTVKVRRSGLNTLIVSVGERSPSAVVCADLPDLSDIDDGSPSTNCYLADETGFAYKRVLDADVRQYNRYYFPDMPSQVGRFATTSADWKKLQVLVDSIKSAGIGVQSLLVKGGGEYELYALNPTGGSIVVIHMNEKAGLDTEKDNLVAFWQKVTSQARSKGAILEWNDIKLQYPPNVYYTEVK